MSIDASIHIEELDREASLAAIEDEWEDLWARCPSATPFQSPAWILPWWQSFGRGALFSVAFRQGERLVGLAPLYLDGPDRTLRLLGTGNTDYLDVLFEPALEQACVRALMRYLEGVQDRWDVCDLHQLRPQSALLAASTPSAWSDRMDVQDVCPVLRLPDSGGNIEGDLAAAVPNRFLKQVAYYRRRTAREGEATFESASSDSLDDLFAALLQLHHARWREEDDSGVLSDQAVREFHREIVHRMAQRRVLRMYALRLEGKIAACYYGFLHRGHAYYYLSGFDPRLAALSLGNQIVLHAIEQAAQEGAHTFDFLRGREEYKYRWGATDIPNRRRIFTAEDTRNAIAERPWFRSATRPITGF